jgi:hypothetical protein
MNTDVLTRIPSSHTRRVWSTALLVNLFLALTGWAQEPPTQQTRPRKIANVSHQAESPAKSTKPRPLTRDEISETEFQLAQIGYWLRRADGVWDESSRYALMAFQKVEGREITGKLTRNDYEHLMFAKRPAAREGGVAHVEVDLRRQVLFLVNDQAEVTHILPVSTGNGEEFTSQGWTRDAITPPGRFTVERQVAGWRKSPLGMIYYPNYIFLGIAIHGSTSVPAKPASHGCIRIPLWSAPLLYQMLPKGTPVIVYDGLTPLPPFHLFPPALKRTFQVKAMR